MKVTAILTLGVLGYLAAPAAAAPDPAALKRLDDADRRFHAAAASSDPRYMAQAIFDLASAAKMLGHAGRAKAVIGHIRPYLRHHAKEVRLATIRAYGMLAVRGSSRDLRAYADRKRNRKQPHDIKLAAISAWGCIADKGTHGVLLSYIRVPSLRKEKIELALMATNALAGYGNAKGYARYTLLHEYMHAFTLIYAAAHCPRFPSASAKHWYRCLIEDLLKTFHALTGKYATTWQDCDRWWRSNKRRVKAGRKAR